MKNPTLIPNLQSSGDSKVVCYFRLSRVKKILLLRPMT
jgi:hypothetical protein